MSVRYVSLPRPQQRDSESVGIKARGAKVSLKVFL